MHKKMALAYCFTAFVLGGMAIGSQVDNLILEGSEVRTGGDTVYCKPGTESALSGYYVLEHLLLKKDENPLTPANTWQESLFRIQTQIVSKLPILGRSLNEFILRLHDSNLNASRIWLPVTSLADLPDHIPGGVYTKEMFSEQEFLDEFGVKCWGDDYNGQSSVPSDLYPMTF